MKPATQSADQLQQDLDALRRSIQTRRDIYLNQLFELEDSQEGLRALIEKRKPVWKNR